eukprot:5212711-Prymnesium_polylepis.1
MDASGGGADGGGGGGGGGVSSSEVLEDWLKPLPSLEASLESWRGGPRAKEFRLMTLEEELIAKTTALPRASRPLLLNFGHVARPLSRSWSRPRPPPRAGGYI